MSALLALAFGLSLLGCGGGAQVQSAPTPTSSVPFVPLSANPAIASYLSRRLAGRPRHELVLYRAQDRRLAR